MAKMVVVFRCPACKITFEVPVESKSIKLSQNNQEAAAKAVTVTGKCPKCKTDYKKTV